MINFPHLPIGHPERNFDCEMAMEEEFRELAGRAEAAGWSRGEVATAMLSLAENILFGDRDDQPATSATEAAARINARLPDSIAPLAPRRLSPLSFAGIAGQPAAVTTLSK